MLVTLIGKNSLYKVVLPKIPIGNYWITDNTLGKEKKLVNVEGKDGHWQIKTDANVKVINSNAIDISDDKIKLKKMAGIYSKGTILKEYNMYALMLDDMDDEIYILYCAPACDNEIYHLNIENIKEFYIGSGSQCQIIYDNFLVSDIHAKIFQMNGRWVIDNFDKRIGTFINGGSAESSARVLLNGDVIFILGLKIIIMGNSIFINNPSNKVKYSRQFFQLNDEVQKLEANANEIIDDEEIELYSSKDYFSRAPRITNIIEEEKVKIDAPPQIGDKEEMPAILVLGSSLSMGLMMMISIVMTIDGRVNGTASAKETFFSLAMAFVMLISMILFPILTQKWEKKRKVRYEEKRQKRYKEYLNQKRTTINKIKNKQREILYANYVSIEECTKIILHKDSRLWERKIEDYDFLSIRWGIGNVPLKIDLQFPEEQFEMEDDNLLEILHSIADNSKMIEMAPIVTSLVEKNISGIIVKNEEVFKKIMQNIIIQLIAFHSYEDLKIVMTNIGNM